MHIILLLLATLLVACSSEDPDVATTFQIVKPSWSVFLSLGQSNCKGSSLPATADTTWQTHSAAAVKNLQDPQTDWYLCSDVAGDAAVAWRTARPGVTWGPELTFGRVLSDYRRRVAIIKFAVGGCGTDCWVNDVPNRYDQALAYAETQMGLLAAVLPGETLVYTGVLWTIGESDADDATQAAAAGGVLTDMQAAFRTDLSAPNLSMIVPLLHSGTNLPHRAAFNSSVATAVAAEVTAGRRAATISLEHMSAADFLLVDEIHHEPAGSEEIGRLAAMQQIAWGL